VDENYSASNIIFASAELWPMKALIRPPNSSEMREELGYFIGKVFVSEAHRGQGVGKSLSKSVLFRVVAGSEDPKDIFYGSSFVYGVAASGRGVFGPNATWIDQDIISWQPEEIIETNFDWKPIRYEDIEGFIKRDVELSRTEFASLPPSDKVRFRVLPSWEALQMRIVGYRFNDKLFGQTRMPEVFGGSIGDPSDPSTWAFALWFHCRDTKSIDIDRIRAPNLDCFKTLMTACSGDCHYYGPKQCLMQGVPDGFTVEDIGASISQIDMPGLFLKDFPREEVAWLHNEFFTQLPNWSD